MRGMATVMSVVPSDTAERDEDLPPVTSEERPEPPDPARGHACLHRASFSRRAASDGVRRARRRARRARPTPRRGRRRARARRRGAPASPPRRPRAPADRSAVTVSVVTRRSACEVARSTRPRSTSVSTVADTVGLVSASCPARWLARSVPPPIIARSRYCARVSGGWSSPHAALEQAGPVGRAVRSVVVHTGSVPNSS